MSKDKGLDYLLDLNGEILVLRQGDIDGFRATQMIQDMAQSAENGKPFLRTAT
jgi:hypothetical protein